MEAERQQAAEPLSFAALPHPDTWDDAWIRRVSRFTAEDLCTMHQQYAAVAAMLYPKVRGAYSIGNECGLCGC